MLRPGEVFAGYRTIRRLGAGGMGEVYLANDRDLPRLVALKLLTRSTSGNEELRGRFEREANTVARLNHPNIVTIYARGEEGDQRWIAMAFVDGTDVARELAHGRPMDPVRAVRIITETADAIDHANDAGILHRDVKPANILLAAGTRERAILTDFGIAKAFDDNVGLTQTGDVLASLQYSAPERLDPAVVADRRVDVYSLGCTLYHMLTGVQPYAGGNAAQLMHGHLNGAIPRPSVHNPHLPIAFDDVIARALAKDPAHRFASCGELAYAAERALHQQVVDQRDYRAPFVCPQSPMAPTQSANIQIPKTPPGRSRTPIVIGISVAIAALVLGGGYAAVRLTDQSRGPAQPTAAPTTTVATRDLRDNAATDITPYTSIALLPTSFTDDLGATFELQSGGPPTGDTPPDCSHAGGSAVVEMLAEHGCKGMMIGVYLEKTSPGAAPPVLISVEIFPLPDATTAQAAAAALNPTLQRNLVFWHPNSGVGSNVNTQGTSDPHRVEAFNVQHRYLTTALAARTDLSQDTAIDPALQSAARKAVQSGGPQ
ncbi:serine/threonine-protein kinase [Nocardia sp. NPDC059240]|uniref:serine/threonine-protein kinase n=1 Tax=Nocardia sp. NPDC059240 TaxID=3346786 RepID=UPI0036AFCB0E